MFTTHSRSVLKSLTSMFVCLVTILLITPQASYSQGISSGVVTRANSAFKLESLEDLLYSENGNYRSLFDCQTTFNFESGPDHLRYVCTTKTDGFYLIEFSKNIAEKSSVMICLPSISEDGNYFRSQAIDEMEAFGGGSPIGTQYFMGYMDGWFRDYVNIYAELEINGWGGASCWSLLRR